MNFRIKGSILVCLLVAGFLSKGLTGQSRADELNIRSIDMLPPSPAVPFYHFKAIVDIGDPSMIRVEASVDGDVLRSTDIYRSVDDLNPDFPPLTQRPPSGYGLSVDATLYQTPVIIGWFPWEPGHTYNVQLRIRLKSDINGSGDDRWVQGSGLVAAPADLPVFNRSWKKCKSVVLSETAGIDRISEPVEVVLAFYPDEVTDLKREIRVVAVDPEDYTLTEVPSQVYDIYKYEKSDDLAPDSSGTPGRDIPLWFPTVTARVAFLAEVGARTSRVYLIYYGNDRATSVSYDTPLEVDGEMPGLHVETGAMEIFLHPRSGHLDQIALSDHPEAVLYHRLETNGAIHWNPEMYSPPRPWTHTSDWDPVPHTRLSTGPVKAISELWGPLRDIPEVSASVRYEFFSGKPYFISSTSLRIDETVWALAVRNGEIVFQREMMTHAAWYDEIRDSVMVFDVTDIPDLTDVKMEADVPWITFYNEKTGIGFAGINLEYANGGLENPPRLLNPYMYITVGPWVYWARALILPFLSSNMQQMLPALKGNFFMEKWAFLIYETGSRDQPYKPILEWERKLKNPLRVHLVEEVDDRVSRSVHEVLVGDGKTGWEGRDTKKRH